MYIPNYNSSEVRSIEADDIETLRTYMANVPDNIPLTSALDIHADSSNTFLAITKRQMDQYINRQYTEVLGHKYFIGTDLCNTFIVSKRSRRLLLIK